MMSRPLCFLILSYFLIATGLRADTLSVSAAASLKEAMTEIAKSYQRDTGNSVDLNFGASGTLESQIRNGAPVDVFISAADEQVKALIQDGLAEESSRRIVATNSLVLIVPADSASELKEVKGLLSKRIVRIAVGDPKVVPAGMYAKQAIASLKMEDALREKLVYGASVRQVLTYVERGEVDAGVVYKTDALAGGEKIKQVAVLDSSTHDKIEYPAVVLKGSAKAAMARKFLEYFASEKAQGVLKSRGFDSPNEAKR